MSAQSVYPYFALSGFTIKFTDVMRHQFSKKMFNTVYTDVVPVIKSKYSDKVQIIFRQQIQPWHPSSTLVHEAGAAVLQLAPDKFYPFSKALFDQSGVRCIF